MAISKYSKEKLKATWDKFFTAQGLLDEIIRIGDDYPESRSIALKFWNIDHFDSQFSEELLSHPWNLILAGEETILDLLPQALVDEKKPHIKIRIHGIPDENRTDVRDLRSDSLRKFIGVEGIVRRVTDVRPMLIQGTFQCLRCYAKHKIDQHYQTIMIPLECTKDNGGCGRAEQSTAFKRMSDYDIFRDVQTIEIMEAPESVSSGLQPQRLTIFLTDDLVARVVPGDRVLITGILSEQEKWTRRQQSTTFDILLVGNYIEMLSRSYEDIQIDEAEIEKFKEMAQDENIEELIINSIAPAIYGMYIEKLVLGLQLFGGIPKQLEDGTYLRGDIHVLLIGDPGTAKTELMNAKSKLSPKCIKASGKSTSGPGLTAAAVKDEFGTGRYTLEAGAMTLADGGDIHVDEFEKMNKNDRQVMNEALEQQEIHIAKGGIIADLKTRCSLTACANPVYGRFDMYQPISGQFKLEPSLLSRIDVILVIQDLPDKETDTKISDHILNIHQGGEINKDRKRHGDLRYSEEDEKKKLDWMTLVIERDVLRRYIAYSKRDIFPVIGEAGKQELRDYYVEMRSRGMREGETVSITPRQLGALIRLCEARARMRLSHNIESEDIEKVKQIMEYFLSKVASDHGIIDIGKLDSGITKSQRDRIIDLLDLIRDADQGEGVEKVWLLDQYEQRNLTTNDLDEDIRRARRDRNIFEPRHGFYKVIE